MFLLVSQWVGVAMNLTLIVRKKCLKIHMYFHVNLDPIGFKLHLKALIS